MYSGEDITQRRKDIRLNILKSFEADLEKARSGVYADNAQNKALNRVGQQYGSKKIDKYDKYDNPIGDGSYHADYKVEDFKDYPQIHSSVSKSSGTESVYVTYSYRHPNEDFARRATVRFSGHQNNAVKFGDQISGNSTNAKNDVLVKLGLMRKIWVPRTKLSVKTQHVGKARLSEYVIADKTIDEILAMGSGANISKYKGKIAKDSNILILGNKVQKVNTIYGKYGYENIKD